MPFKKTYDWEQELPHIRQYGSVGMTMAEVARKYGISRQRMKQVVDKFIPDWSTTCGLIVNRQEKAEAYYKKWGEKESTELYEKKREKFRAKKANAVRIGYTWEIDFSDIVWNDVCPILGIPLDYYAHHVQENSPSFDQIDAGLGYVKGNVHIISWRANRIKNNGTAQEHRQIADYLDSISTIKLDKSIDTMLQ